MPANTSPIFPGTPLIGRATFTSAAAITSRANIAGVTGLSQLVPAQANGARIDLITVKAKGTSVASNVFIWLSDGTTSMLFDEIDVTAVTASNTADSGSFSKSYSNLVLPAGWQILASQTVQTDLTVHAFGGAY